MVVSGLVAALVVVAFGAGWVLAGWQTRRRATPALVAAPVVSDSPSLRDVLDAHHVGVAIADARARVTYRNDVLQTHDGNHIGVMLGEAIERHVSAGVEGRSLADLVESYGPPPTVFTLDSHPLSDGGVVVFVTDVSDRRRIDQVRTDFVANISHELKTPIGALSVLAEMLDGESDPATVSRLVDRLNAEADRAAHTIDDLLELSRIELDGDRSHELVDVIAVVGQAVDRVAETAAQRGVTISRPTGSADEELTVWGDARQLVSALGNLVENAVKHSEAASKVCVDVRPGDTHVELSVTDEGCGIPQRDLERVFERFYRVDDARSRATGGTGLGLSIVRHVATNHGGEVGVTSAEGVGSTFVLRLPRARAGAA